MGEAIVRRFAASGATVGTTARSLVPGGNTAKLFVQADISTRDGVDQVIAWGGALKPLRDKQVC